MNWFEPMDIYCERLGPEFWSEPINALTNGFFILAAVLCFSILLHKQKTEDYKWGLWLSSWLLIIGIGSFLFHTFANRWSMLADVLPILIFILSYVAYLLRRKAGISTVKTIFAVFGYFALSVALEIILPKDILNGSLAYLAPLLMLLGFSLYFRNHQKNLSRSLLYASGLFLMSLTFRTLDSAVCGAWPLGTHFLWHSLNGLLLFYLTIQTIKPSK